MNQPMTTTDIERRLEAALHARADLVQPEDLEVFTPLVAPARSHARRIRVTTYVAAAAACAAGIAGTYVITHRDASAPDPAPAPGPPDGWQGGIGRTGTASDQQAYATATADLDGDGAPDTVWVRTTGAKAGPVRVEALLSSTPDDVRWTLLDEQAVYASLESPAQLDDDAADELVVSMENGSHYEYVVVDLVDGRLQEAPAPDGALDSGGRPGGRTRAPRVVDGRLLTWVSRGPIADDARYVRTDATWWTIAEVEGVRRLAPAETGDLCMDFFDGLAGACLAGDKPDAELPDMSGDNPGDEVPDLLPVAGRLGIDERLDIGDGRSARLAGPPEHPSLQVEADGETLTADLGAGEPARLVDGVLEGQAGPAVLVDRGASWSAYAVRDGALTELYVSDEAVLGTTGDTRTELSRSGLLWTAVGGVADDSEVERFSQWSLDQGPGLLSHDIGCFRLPADGSDPTFANC